jgi:hypothetical protein
MFKRRLLIATLLILALSDTTVAAPAEPKDRSQRERSTIERIITIVRSLLPTVNHDGLTVPKP